LPETHVDCRRKYSAFGRCARVKKEKGKKKGCPWFEPALATGKFQKKDKNDNQSKLKTADPRCPKAEYVSLIVYIYLFHRRRLIRLIEGL
jgi:hypothetical protein